MVFLYPFPHKNWVKCLLIIAHSLLLRYNDIVAKVMSLQGDYIIYDCIGKLGELLKIVADFQASTVYTDQ